jgi:hypothetical protein
VRAGVARMGVRTTRGSRSDPGRIRAVPRRGDTVPGPRDAAYDSAPGAPGNRTKAAAIQPMTAKITKAQIITTAV